MYNIYIYIYTRKNESDLIGFQVRRLMHVTSCLMPNIISHSKDATLEDFGIQSSLIQNPFGGYMFPNMST